MWVEILLSCGSGSKLFGVLSGSYFCVFVLFGCVIFFMNKMVFVNLFWIRNIKGWFVWNFIFIVVDFLRIMVVVVVVLVFCLFILINVLWIIVEIDILLWLVICEKFLFLNVEIIFIFFKGLFNRYFFVILNLGRCRLMELMVIFFC